MAGHIAGSAATIALVARKPEDQRHHDWVLYDFGQATAFMIVGPATKITNLGALKIVLGIKRFIIYILFCVLFAILAGMLVDMF